MMPRCTVSIRFRSLRFFRSFSGKPGNDDSFYLLFSPGAIPLAHKPKADQTTENNEKESGNDEKTVGKKQNL